MRKTPFGLLDSDSLFNFGSPPKDAQLPNQGVESPAINPSRKNVLVGRPKSARSAALGPSSSSKPEPAAATSLPAAAAAPSTLARPKTASAARPKSASSSRRQLVKEVFTEEVAKAISHSTTAPPFKMAFPFLRKGASNTCSTYSYLFTGSHQEDAETPEEKRKKFTENSMRVQRLADERKKRHEEQQSSFSKHLYQDMFQFYQRILLTLQEANDICSELRISTVFELILLPYGGLDTSTMPTTLEDLADPLHMNPDNAIHLSFLTHVYLHTDNVIQIQKRLNVVNLRASLSNASVSSSGLLLAGRTNKYIFNARDVVSLTWKAFLKEHEVLQKRYRRFKILHPESTEQLSLSMSMDVSELAAMEPPANDNKPFMAVMRNPKGDKERYIEVAANDSDNASFAEEGNGMSTRASISSTRASVLATRASLTFDPNAPIRSSQSKNDGGKPGGDGNYNSDLDDGNDRNLRSSIRMSQGIGSSMLNAVRQVGSIVDLANDVANDAPRPSTAKRVVFQDKGPDEECKGEMRQAKDVRSLGQSGKGSQPGRKASTRSALTDQQEKAIDQENWYTTPATAATPQEIQSMLDVILKDLQGKQGVVEEQIHSIQNKGWNLFAKLT